MIVVVLVAMMVLVPMPMLMLSFLELPLRRVPLRRLFVSLVSFTSGIMPFRVMDAGTDMTNCHFPLRLEVAGSKMLVVILAVAIGPLGKLVTHFIRFDLILGA